MYHFPTICSLEYQSDALHKAHPNYQRLLKHACKAHQDGRNPNSLPDRDIQLARLYCYAFRRHAIGVFHATRVVLEEQPESPPACQPHRLRARELLADLANQSVDTVPVDFRVLLGTFYRYEIQISRAVDALIADANCGGGDAVRAAANRFVDIVNHIRGCCGIELTRDDEAPDQASFVVPGLGITIVPLVYGDYHSWNLAWLDPNQSDVPYHQHSLGVEVHLGYGPMNGHIVLGDAQGPTQEGYALPIPPDTRHGYTNAGPLPHNLPFIFGSLKRAGWGIFFDVEPQPIDLSELREVPPDSPDLNHALRIEREIASMTRLPIPMRKCILPASLTDRKGTGGLELHLNRAPEGRPVRLVPERFLALSVVNGTGTLRMLGESVRITHHDHFALPAGITAEFEQTGSAPLVVMDADLRPSHARRIGARK